MKFLPLILLAVTVQAQTIYNCGTKKADNAQCLPVGSCVYSASTRKKYCGATIAAAEAQEMANEGICTVLDTSGCVGGGAYPPTIALDHVVVQKSIRYCDDLKFKDQSECVMHEGEYNGVVVTVNGLLDRVQDLEKQAHETNWFGDKPEDCRKGEHRSLLDISIPLPIGTGCVGTRIGDCSTHHLIDVCERNKQ